MSSYHTSFTYNGKNSFYENLIIVAFDPDDGFKDSFLSMDNISDDYYDGTKKINYGSRYNTTADVQISVIKKDGTDMTLKEFRSYAKWLTGARTDSWLDMYIGDYLAPVTEFMTDGETNTFVVPYTYSNPVVQIDGNMTDAYQYSCTQFANILTFDEAPYEGAFISITESPIYSFLGKITNFEQYKYDARTTGIRLTFSSVSPWAFSAQQPFECNIGQVLRIQSINNQNVLTKSREKLGVYNGVLCPSYLSAQSYFNVLDDGTAYIDTSFHKTINNESDDLYTYIYLDIDYFNDSGDDIVIKNETLGEETIIKGIDPGEIISISNKQFIISYSLDTVTGEKVRNTHKIFGSNFNFVWPRLAPGENDFSIYGSGAGVAKFTYRYPMKIGDCTIDIDVHGGGIGCTHTEA